MDFYSSLDRVPADFGPSAVTFGKFDGLHTGHRQIVDQLLAASAHDALVSTVLTFDRNPLSVLDPARCPANVVSVTQKRELIEAAGVDAMVELAFDRAFSLMPADAFIETILVEALHARVVLVGPDTRFGEGGKGDFALLERLGARSGFRVKALDLLIDDVGSPVSSTHIRQLLAVGNVAKATELLGRAPAVRAVVVHGQKRGRALGYPTANLSPDSEGFIPADGVYAGYLIVDGERMPSAISIGNNPTFEGVRAKQIEAHVIDADLDLYDKTVTVEFVEFIRGMVKYSTLEALIEQMGSDTDRARHILRMPAATP